MAIARRNVCLFVCLFSWGDESKSLTGSARKLDQSPLLVGHSEAAMTGILQGFSLRICVHLRLHTRDLQLKYRPQSEEYPDNRSKDGHKLYR